MFSLLTLWLLARCTDDTAAKMACPTIEHDLVLVEDPSGLGGPKAGRLRWHPDNEIYI